MTIKAPVRPTPALWLKREISNCYSILFPANNIDWDIQMSHLWKYYLQCVIAGPASGVFIEITLLRNWRNGAGCSGTPWSGQAVYWNCFTSRRSVYPIYFYGKRYKIIPNWICQHLLSDVFTETYEYLLLLIMQSIRMKIHIDTKHLNCVSIWYYKYIRTI